MITRRCKVKVKVNIDEKLDQIFIDIYTPSEDERLKSILDNLQMKKSILNGYIDEKVYLLKINNIYSIYAENKKRQSALIFYLYNLSLIHI